MTIRVGEPTIYHIESLDPRVWSWLNTWGIIYYDYGIEMLILLPQ